MKKNLQGSRVKLKNLSLKQGLPKLEGNNRSARNTKTYKEMYLSQGSSNSG